MPMATTSSLDVANRLRPVLLQLGRGLRKEAHELGITGGQAALLGAIKGHPELGVRELAAREGISAPAMSRYLDRLESAGYLNRERDPADGRRIRLVLTPRGISINRSLRLRRTAWLAARVSSLSQEELEVIDAAIEPLLKLVGEDD
jgi:DNA-binding MarR family transcriptional regulator